LKSVCDDELDGGEKDSNWPLVPSSCRSDIEAKVSRFLEGSAPLPELDNARPIYDQSEQIKKQNKALRFDLRNEHTLRKGETFQEYHQSLFVEAARFLIHRPRLPGQRQIPLAALDFSFTASAMRNKIRNSALDRNWQADAEQLCFLVDVDARSHPTTDS
jgi:hypothetical protein